MDSIITTDTNSNAYFFLSNFSDTLKAGKNSFTINTTSRIVPNTTITVSVYDSKNNLLPSGLIKPTDAKYTEQTNTGDLYYVNISKSIASGIGRIEISGVGLDYGTYNGNVAYFNGQAYPVSNTQKLPLLQAPAASPIPQVNISWSRNVLIDTSKKADCEVRFFDYPYIEVTPEIHSVPFFPTASYLLASGSFSSIAILPKNNSNADYDYQFDTPIYQLYWKGGTKFNSLMVGEKIRIKNPLINNFTYNNQTNNQIAFAGTLYTDFVANIRRVINESTLLLDIPFSTVAELVNKINEDSPYNKNNLVDIKLYSVNNEPDKQAVSHKKNIYILSIESGEFEIFYKNISTDVSRNGKKQNSINIAYNNLRLLSGKLERYRVYGKSLNTPHSKTLLCEGKIEPRNLIASTLFDSGLYNSPGEFYSPAYLSKYWLSQGTPTFNQDHTVFINGAVIGHTGNSNQTDYIIFKDNTSAGRTAAYINYNLVDKSYWYSKSPAFVNFETYPTQSYLGVVNIPQLASYTNSQENLLTGAVHDSNPIKLRANSLYQFSMYVKSDPSNTLESKLYVYFLSGGNKIMIGEIDNTFGSGINEKYKYTFFSDISRYGTIILVPVLGSWNISEVELVPYQAIDYSIDSFDIKIPLKVSVANELYEIEAELYDGAGNLAYGTDSYTFIYNKEFMPLKKQIFVDPSGLTTSTSFGPYININESTGTITANVFNTP